MNVDAKLKKLLGDLRINADVMLKYPDINVFGEKIHLQARELVVLYVWIEKEFKIQIPDSSIVEGKFSTYNGIKKIIEEQLKQKEL